MEKVISKLVRKRGDLVRNKNADKITRNCSSKPKSAKIL